MKRKLLSAALAVIMVVMLCVPALAAGPTLTYNLTSGGSNAVTVEAGSDVTVTFTIKASGSYSLNSIQNVIPYDEDFLTLKSKSAGIGEVAEVAYLSGNTVQFSDKLANYSAAQVVGTITFTVNSGATGSTILRSTKTKANDSTGTAMSITTQDLTITVGTPTPPAVPVTGVTLSPKPVTLKVGGTQQLAAAVLPANASNKALTWVSGNTGIVTVSDSGLVTAKAAGTTSVTAIANDGSGTIVAIGEGTAVITVRTENGKTASCTVAVTKAAGGTGDRTVVPADPIVTAFSNEGGTVTPDGAQTVTPGSSITFRMKANSGCTLEAVYVDGRNVGAVSEYTFVNVREAHTIYASFNDPNGGRYDACPRDYTCPIDPFTDTRNDAWWHDGIHYCLEKGLMQGVSLTRFSPNGTTTRAMIVTILWRMEGSPVIGSAMSFKDVESGKWYTEAIRWAQSTGVVEGYSAEKFGPMDSITREQMAAIMYRYAKYKGYSVNTLATLGGFTDRAQISSWALDAMKWANGAGLITGRTVNTLAPAASPPSPRLRRSSRDFAGRKVNAIE